MNDVILQKFADELLHLIMTHIIENKQGISDIGTDYWHGRLFDSEEIHKEINSLINKYQE